jgi:hypothetical protein
MSNEFIKQMLLQEDLEKLAYYMSSDWCLYDVYECFKPKDDNEKMYWSNKYDSNILKFYLTLDKKNRGILYDYILSKM